MKSDIIGKILSVIPAKTVSETASALAITSLGLNSVVSVVGGGSTTSIFSVMNQFQILLLFPLLDVYLSSPVLEFYNNINWAVGSLDIVDYEKMNFNNSLTAPFLESQEDENLKILGLEYESTLANMITVI